MSSVGRNMDTLPGMTTEDFTVNKPSVKFTVMSDETTTGTCRKCGFFKRAWDAVKCCCCKETIVEVIDPPLLPGTPIRVVYVQQSSDREQISSQTSSVSGSSVLSDSSGEDTEPQGLKRIRKCLKRLRKRTGAGLHRVRCFFRGLRERIRRRLRRSPNHHSKNSQHEEPNVLGVREQISSAVPSVNGSSLSSSEQVHDETFEEERKEEGICGGRTRKTVKCPFRRICRKTQEQHAKEEKKKGNFFKRTWKAVKRPFRHCKTRVEPVEPDTPVLWASRRQQTADREQISSERTSVRVPSATESIRLQDIEENYLEEQHTEETCERTPLSDAPFLKPSDEKYESLYKEISALGKGGYGSVALATRKSDGQQVAVKCVKKAQNGAFDENAEYMIEVKMMSRLQKPPVSPYVIQMLEWFDFPDEIKIVMEYPGPCMDLQKLLYPDMQTSTEPVKLDEEKIRIIMRQAAQAVKHCHDHKVFHNDIHPGNILVNTKTFDIKLIDFGCALEYTSDPYPNHKYIGACEYWPPEYETGDQFEGKKTNVFQLGMILQNMCTSVRVNTECRELYLACLLRDPSDRLTLEKILENKWLGKD